MDNVLNIIGKLEVPPGQLFDELKQLRNADGNPAFSPQELEQADALLHSAGLPADADAFDGSSLNDLMHALYLIHFSDTNIPAERWKEKIEVVRKISGEVSAGFFEWLDSSPESGPAKNPHNSYFKFAEEHVKVATEGESREETLAFVLRYLEDYWLINGPDWWKILRDLGPLAKQALPLIEKGLESDAPKELDRINAGMNMRIHTLWTLGLIGEPSSAEPIITFLKQEKTKLPEEVVIVAVAALGMIGSDKAISFLKGMQDHPDKLVRHFVSLALAQATGASTDNALVQALQGWRDAPRFAAVRLSRFLEIEEAAPALYDLIGPNENSEWALRALKELGPRAKAVLPDVMRQMKICRFWGHETFWALDLIKSIGSADAGPLLVEQLQDELSRMRSMDAEEIAQYKAHLREVPDGVGYAQRLIELLGKLRYRGAADILLEATREQYAAFGIRAAAIKASGKLGKGKWIFRAEQFLADRDEEVRLATIEAFGELPAYEAMPLLLDEFRHNSSERVKMAAVEQLGWIRPEAASAVPELISYWNEDHIYGAQLSDEDDLTGAILVALGLHHAHPELTVPLLSRELACSNLKHRFQAAASLGKMEDQGRPAFPDLLAALAVGQSQGVGFFMEEALKALYKEDVRDTGIKVVQASSEQPGVPGTIPPERSGNYYHRVDYGTYSLTLYTTGARRVMTLRRKGEYSEEDERLLEMAVNVDIATLMDNGAAGGSTQHEYSAEIFLGESIHLRGSIVMDDKVKLTKHTSDVEFADFYQRGVLSLNPFLRNSAQMLLTGSDFEFASVRKLSTSLEGGLALYVPIFDAKMRISISGGMDQVFSPGLAMDTNPIFSFSADVYHL